MATRKEMRERLRDWQATRFGQLAFAYGIGMPYKRVEYTVRQRNEPDPYIIFRYLIGCFAHIPSTQKGELEAALAPIRAWLETPPTPELTASVYAAREALMTRKRENGTRIQQERALARAG